MSTLESFDAVVAALNEASQDLGVFRKYWAGLPVGVKNGMKASMVAVIDQAIANLAAVKAEIGAS